MQELQQIGDLQTCTSAVIVRNATILLGLRNYNKAKEWKTVPVWTTPGGRCNLGETIEAGLRRETKEETGITDLHIKKFIAVVPGAKEGDTVHLFLCETDEEPRLMEPDKFSEWRWFPIDDLPINFINPDARKIITCAELLNYETE
jgi:ADP-ribose pyrophosphatase YjhB (NUDIX family)